MIDVTNCNEHKKALISHLNELKKLPVEEFTFREKYNELTEDDTTPLELNRAFNKVWRPRNIFNERLTISEMEKLNTIMVPVKDKELLSLWRILRTYCSTMPNRNVRGRNLKFMVMDTITEKVLGVAIIASDFGSIKTRDDYIGWSKTNKFQDKRLHCSANAACVVPTQPFGYNFLGGKLIASLLTTKIVRDAWFNQYGDILAGITVTALYGKRSMYQRIPGWRECGETAGTTSVSPDEEYYKAWYQWLSIHRDYASEQIKRGASERDRLIKLMFKECGLRQSDYANNFHRGCYYAGLYSNFKEFFQNKIGERDLVLKPTLARDVTGVLDGWKQRAINRYRNLLRDNRINPEVQSYLKINKSMDYDRAKALYLGRVGR